MRRMTESQLTAMLFQAIGKASLGLHTDATRSVVRQIVAAMRVARVRRLLRPANNEQDRGDMPASFRYDLSAMAVLADQ